MPRYFFDLDDDQLSTTDDHGEDFPGLEAAERNAIAVATSVARDLFPSGGNRVTVRIRDQATAVFEATVSLTTSRLER